MSRLDLPLAIVTGASSGVGLHASKALTDRGWHVLMACRDLDKAGAAAQELGLPPTQYDIAQIDLSSLASVTRGYVSQPLSGERVAQVVTDPTFDRSGVRWSWGHRQREGREAFAQSLSSQATDAERSAFLWQLTERLVGLA